MSWSFLLLNINFLTLFLLRHLCYSRGLAILQNFKNESVEEKIFFTLEDSLYYVRELRNDDLVEVIIGLNPDEEYMVRENWILNKKNYRLIIQGNSGLSKIILKGFDSGLSIEGDFEMRNVVVSKLEEWRNYSPLLIFPGPGRVLIWVINKYL